MNNYNGSNNFDYGSGLNNSNVGYNNGTNFNSGYVDSVNSVNSGYNNGSTVNVGYNNVNNVNTGYPNSGSVSDTGYIGNSINLNPNPTPNTGFTNGINSGNGYVDSNNNFNNGYLNNGNSYNYNNGYNIFTPNQPNTLLNQKKRIRVSFNSPVILSFTIICLVILVVDYLLDGIPNYYLFSVYRSSLLDPLTYIRFFGHALGHADFEHYIGNMMTMLIVGPLLEEKYGSKSIILVMVVTAFVTGVLNFIFFPDVRLLGASGIVFAFILLSSFTSMKDGEIPLTFILVAVLYLGEQVLEGMFIDDNISNFGHILGGICGSALGYALNKDKIPMVRSGGSNNVNNNNNNNNNQMTYY